MASTKAEAPPTKDDKVNSSPLGNNVPVEHAEEKPNTTANQEKKETIEEEQRKRSTPVSAELNGTLSTKSGEQEAKADIKKQEKTESKSRSVNFASTTEYDMDVPKSHSIDSTNSRSHHSPRSSRRSNDFIDALVDSYKIEASANTSSLSEEKKYVPKTNRARLNPNWREHRTRRLMNKLEELSLWDREEELKASQAQALREQKWEQILDRQRNHDLCLSLMRQRHESEMESAIKLDRVAAGINDENTAATIANTMNLSSAADVIAYDLPTPPHALKRRVRENEEKALEVKTPIGRYRQFEKNMNNKLDKINQKLQPDREIMRAYNPYFTSIPSASLPLFSETYSALLSVPDTYPTNKYNQYHYGAATYLHQPQHASSPDYETRLRSYSHRDVRVPLKEQENEYGHNDDDYVDEYKSDDDHYKKYRSNRADENLYKKYRANPIDDDIYTKPRAHLLNDDDLYIKPRSNPIENDYYSKYRSGSNDDGYYSKHRFNYNDEDYNPKNRSSLADEDYRPKYRSNAIEEDDEDYSPKYRSNPNEDNYYTKYRSMLSSRLDYSPPRRTTSLASPTASSLYDCSTVTNTPREYSFIHSRQPASTSIHLRSLNDDLNAITSFSTETSKKILHSIGDSANEISTKVRTPSGSSTTTKKNARHDDQNIENENVNYKPSKAVNQPIEIISLSSTR